MQYQDIIVCVVGLLAAVWLCCKLYRLLFSRKAKDGKCAGCPGCGMGDKRVNE